MKTFIVAVAMTIAFMATACSSTKKVAQENTVQSQEIQVADYRRYRDSSEIEVAGVANEAESFEFSADSIRVEPDGAKVIHAPKAKKMRDVSKKAVVLATSSAENNDSTFTQSDFTVQSAMMDSEIPQSKGPLWAVAVMLAAVAVAGILMVKVSR